MGRLMAIDYGQKRLGVALSDETKSLALAKPHLPAADRRRLLAYMAAHEVEAVILGLPKNLRGWETAAAEDVKKFAKWLSAQTGLPVHFVDERYTTRQAGQILKEQRLKGQKLRQNLDSVSAQILLTTFLKRLKS